LSNNPRSRQFLCLENSKYNLEIKPQANSNSQGQWVSEMSEREKLKQRLEPEIRESLEHKLVLRREAPFIGLVSFVAALWITKLFTAMSPGSSLIFQLGGFNIHLHHFNYGFVLLVLGLMLTFFEGAWIVRVQHLFFGIGLGLIVDEYWLLLTFDENASNYFGPQSKFISLMIAMVITVAYAAIAFGVFFKSRKEVRLWRQLYKEVKSGKVKLSD
jgi:hypothetical protein